MDLRLVAELPSPPAAVFAEVRDLDGYPAWLDLVEAAVPDVGGQATGGPEAGGSGSVGARPAWRVTLAARLGPVRRAKEVRMVRVTEQAPALVRFQRAETDGRPHASWALTVSVEAKSVEAAQGRSDAGSRLTMRLEYGGRLWLPFLDLVVRDEATRAGPRLAALIAHQGGATVAGPEPGA